MQWPSSMHAAFCLHSKLLTVLYVLRYLISPCLGADHYFLLACLLAACLLHRPAGLNKRANPENYRDTWSDGGSAQQAAADIAQQVEALKLAQPSWSAWVQQQVVPAASKA